MGPQHIGHKQYLRSRTIVPGKYRDLPGKVPGFDQEGLRRYGGPMAKPNVLEIALSPLTKQRLEALASAEYFGGSAAAVARRFIEDGVRAVLVDGWLGNAKLPPAASSPSTDATPDD
jgi:hypothetical protein